MGMEKTTQREVLRSALLTKCYSSDKIRKNAIGGARGTCAGEERRTQDFGGES